MPKAFSHLATALACSLVARLSSTSVVVVSRVYAAPEFHPNVLGFLGRTGEGAGKVKMLSRAAKETVDAMHKHEGHPEAHPDLLRVGKLLHVMRHADERNANAADNAIRDLDLNSLLESATPGVAEVARVCKLLAVMQRSGDADYAHRTLPIGRLTIRDLDWNSLPAWAKPEVAEKAIRMHVLEPDQWQSLPIEVRENKHVVLAAIRSRLIPEPSAENWWYSLSPEVQEMPDVVAAALEPGRLGDRSAFLWRIMAFRSNDSLPPGVLRTVLAAKRADVDIRNAAAGEAAAATPTAAERVKQIEAELSNDFASLFIHDNDNPWIEHDHGWSWHSST
mmetsp:Transcript_12920/g.31481  ORF Transcript_12920/g.31481 Transcript_12920/m.31481 type:complete len:335 (+) Transcript_12920:141-1145(+)